MGKRRGNNETWKHQIWNVIMAEGDVDVDVR